MQASKPTPQRHHADAMVDAVSRCLGYNVRKAMRAVTQLFDDELRPTGLRSTQFTLLVVVRAFGRVTISRLAEEAVMDRTTLKRNLERLERDGLVRIEAGADARVREVTLTSAAERVMAEAYRRWQAVNARLVHTLGAERVKRLLGDFSTMVEIAQPTDN